MNEPVPKTGLSIKNLHALCKVDHYGGIKAAAPNSDSAQSNMSQMLKALSAAFDVKLTKRQGRGIALTPAGKKLACLAREFFLAIEDFDLRSRNEPSIIAIGAGDSILRWILLPKLETLQGEPHSLRIDISKLRTAEIVEGVRSLTLDIGLIRKSAVPATFKSVAIGTCSYSIWIPQTAMKSSSAALKEILKSVPFAMMKTHWGTVFEDLIFRSANIRVKVSLSCSSFTQVSQALSTGKYAGIMPRFASQHINTSGLQEVRPDFLNQITHEICLAWNPRFTYVKACAEKAIAVLSKQLQFTVAEPKKQPADDN